jgi:hypothetical protein
MNPTSSATSTNAGNGSHPVIGAGAGSDLGAVSAGATATATGGSLGVVSAMDTPGTTDYLNTLFRDPHPSQSQSHPEHEAHLDYSGNRTITARDAGAELDQQRDHNPALRLPVRQAGLGPMLGTSTASPQPRRTEVDNGIDSSNNNDMNPIVENGNVDVGGTVGYAGLFGLDREAGRGDAMDDMGMGMDIDLDVHGQAGGVGPEQGHRQPTQAQAQHDQIGFALPINLQVDHQHRGQGVELGIEAAWDQEALRREHPDLFAVYGQAQVQVGQQQQQQQPQASVHGPGSGRPLDDSASMMPPRKRRFRESTASDGPAGGIDPSPSKTAGLKPTNGPTVSDPRSFVINTGMHNESDALQILAMAATSTKKKQDRPGKRSRSHSESTSMADSSVVAYRRAGVDGLQVGGGTRTEGEIRARSDEGSARRREGAGDMDGDDSDDRVHEGEEGMSTRGGSPHPLSSSAEVWQDGATTRVGGPSWNHGRRVHGKVSFNTSAGKGQTKIPAARPCLLSFPLVAKGIMDPEQVCHFGNMFFSKHHYVFVGV